MSNIVAISGTHGAGKSTLIRDLLQEHPEVYTPIVRLKVPRGETTFEREKLQTMRYSIVFHRAHEKAQNNPDKVYLCDRSYTDNLAYFHAYRERGMITEYEHEQLLELYDKCMPPRESLEHTVFLDSPFEFAVDNVTRRWESSGVVKYNETDFDYMRAVIENFKGIYSTHEQKLLHVTTQNKDERIEQVHAWVQSLCSTE